MNCHWEGQEVDSGRRARKGPRLTVKIPGFRAGMATRHRLSAFRGPQLPNLWVGNGHSVLAGFLDVSRGSQRKPALAAVESSGGTRDTTGFACTPRGC